MFRPRRRRLALSCELPRLSTPTLMHPPMPSRQVAQESLKEIGRRLNENRFSAKAGAALSYGVAGPLHLEQTSGLLDDGAHDGIRRLLPHQPGRRGQERLDLFAPLGGVRLCLLASRRVAGTTDNRAGMLTEADQEALIAGCKARGTPAVKDRR